jgi:hypothetical protein
LRSYFANTSHEEIRKDYLNYYAKLYPQIESSMPVSFKDNADLNPRRGYRKLPTEENMGAG